MMERFQPRTFLFNH